VLLSHLLTGTPVPGLGDAVTPVRIRFQARSISRVDDIVVVGTAPNKAEVAVSIGVRRQPRLVPSEADSVKLIGDGVPDDVWHEAASHYDDRQLAALVMTVATVNAWNRIGVSTRMVAGPQRPDGDGC
jgi:alkylhydroperoxidase family enzyme